MENDLSRYRAMLSVQYLLLITDLLINTLVEAFRHEAVILLVIFVIQDVCLIFSIIIVFLSFFSTQIFQAGFVGYIFNKFRLVLITSVSYLILSIVYHSCSLNIRWHNPRSYWWTEDMFVLYILHRTVACMYYYTYKKTALVITDPRLYKDLSWILK